jgi:phosphohistidine swiveling domain-containing protein
MTYKNYLWEVIGVEYDSPYLRNRLWTESFFRIPELLKVDRVVAAITSRNNKIEYVADTTTLARAHEQLKARILHDHSYLVKAIDESLQFGDELNAWTEEHIFERNLTTLSNQELIDLFENFVAKQEDENVYGQVLSFLDYHFSFMEMHLCDYLRSKTSAQDYEEYYSLFTEPPHSSFAQDQEEALLEILADSWRNPTMRDAIACKSRTDVKREYPAFFARLAEHASRYAWIYFVHMGPAFGEREFYDFAVDYARRGTDPPRKIEQLRQRREDIETRRKQVLAALQPEGLDAFILQISGKVVWAKARRKDHQSRAYYHGEKLLREIARRLFISVEHVRSAPFELISAALAGVDVDWTVVDDIRHFHICLPNDDGSVTTLSGPQAEAFSQQHIARKQRGDETARAQELLGAIACPGKAVGRAKIVNVPQDMAKMEYGDILVSSTTTPSIVPALRKAAAIITDGGGLTCHAAIISREFNIPCVVGLKIATTLIQDGDLLEVDASAARVRKLAE